MPEEIIIYHNGRCSKSRGALEILQERGVPHRVRFYLAEPLNPKELNTLLKQLGMKPSELIRKNEAVYKEQFSKQSFTEKEWLQILLDHPELMERPVVVKDGKAIVARPPERVLELLET